MASIVKTDECTETGDTILVESDCSVHESQSRDNQVPLTMSRLSLRQSHRVRLLGGVLVCACLTVMAFLAGWRFRAADSEAAVTVNETQLDFGTAYVQQDFPWKLDLTNRSSAPATFSAFKASCGCTSVAPKSLTIPPYSTKSVQLRMDLRATDEEEASRILRPFSVSIIPMAHDTAVLPPFWVIRGNVRSLLPVTTRELGFDTEFVHGVPAAPKVFCLRPLVPVNPVACDFDASLGSLRLGADENGTILLHATPNTSLPPGTYHWRAGLELEDGSGRVVPSTPVDLAFHVLDDIACTPPSVLLGSLRVGAIGDAVVRVASRVKRTFQVMSTRMEPPAGTPIEVSTRPDVVATSATIRIRQHITAPGSGRSELHVVIRLTGAEENRDIVVPVLFHGVNVGGEPPQPENSTLTQEPR